MLIFQLNSKFTCCDNLFFKFLFNIKDIKSNWDLEKKMLFYKIYTSFVFFTIFFSITIKK